MDIKSAEMLALISLGLNRLSHSIITANYNEFFLTKLQIELTKEQNGNFMCD